MEQDNKYVSTTNGQYDMNTDTMKNTKIHDNGDNYDIEGVDKKINGLKNYIVDDDDDDDNDDDDDDDFGPETNVDAVDDACEISSNNINKVLFPDNDLMKQQKSSDVEIHDKLEIDDNKPKEKNEAVGDADNVVESEDSDDEWNYYRADTTNNKKVELSSSAKSVELNIDNNSDIEKLKIDVDKKIDDTVTDDNLSEKIDFKKEIEQEIEEKEAVSSSIDSSNSSSDNSSSSEDECDKENLPPVKLAENNTNVSHQLEESLDQIPETLNLTQQESEDMEFQLNPNAAEFIPVSPVSPVPSVPMLPIHHNDAPITGSPVSPLPTVTMLPNHTCDNDDKTSESPVSPVSPGSPVQMLPAHLRDAPISGSPLKPTAIMDDIRLPSPEEFNNEASHRPGEIDEKSLSNLSTPTNGNESPNLSSFKNLDKQKLLFDLDESEVSSTRAEFGDESTASYLTTNDLQKTGVFDGSFTSSFISNEIDPMMMSFGPGDFNPLTKTVDLNAVHDLDDTDLIGENDTSRNGNGNYCDKDDDDDDDDSVNHPELKHLKSPDVDHYKNTQTFPVNETDIMFNRSIPVCNLNRDEYTVTDDISNQVAAMNLANSQQSSNIFYNKNDDNNDVVNVDVEKKNNDNKIEEKHYDNDDFMMSCDASKNIENNVDMIEQVDLMSSNNENKLQNEQMDLMSSNNDDNFNQNIMNSQETLMTPEKIDNHEKPFGFESNADLLADVPVNSLIDTPVDTKTIDDEKLEIETKEIDTIHKVEEDNVFEVSEKIPDIVSNTPEIVEKETQIIENIPVLEEQKNQVIENKTIVEEKLSEIIENGSTIEEEKCPVIKNTLVEEKILENVELPQTDETSSKPVENIIEKIPVDNLLANITEEKTAMKLSESLQEFTGLENEFIPSDKKQTQLPIENIEEKSKDNETPLPTKENDKVIDIKNIEKPIQKTSASSATTKVEPKAKSVNAVKLPASKTTLKVTKTDVKTSLKASPTSPSKTTVTAKTSGTVGVASKKPITRPKTVDASSKTLTATSAKPSATKLSTTAIKSPTTKPVSTAATTTASLKSKTSISAPRPSTLSTKIADKKVATTNGDATKTGTLKPKPASRPLVKPPTAASRPATATTTTTKPRVPSTVSSTKPLTTKSTDVKIQRPKTAPTTLGIASKTTRVSTLTKSPVIDKQIKETANKQISNRTSTMTKTTRTTTTTTGSTTSTLTARRTTATATAKTTSEKKAVTTRISAKSATAVSKSSAINQQQKKVISKVITKTETQNGNCEIKNDNNVVIQEAIVNEVTELKKDPISFPDTTDNQLLITAD